MAVAMRLSMKGVDAEAYDRIHDGIGLDERPAEGLILHTAGISGDTLEVVDIWESEDAFNRFAEKRLLPAVGAAGLGDRPQPQPRLYELYNMYAPAMDEIGRMGAEARSAHMTV
jgi:hypothetical protein